jgi:hypothetical protein
VGQDYTSILEATRSFLFDDDHKVRCSVCMLNHLRLFLPPLALVFLLLPATEALAAAGTLSSMSLMAT